MYKYTTNESECEILPNLLGITSQEDIAEAEFEGFLTAEIVLTEHLTNQTKLNCRYIKEIHKQALGHLYDFAGKYRTVNMSKGGFLFPSVRFISESIQCLKMKFCPGFRTHILVKQH